MTLIPIPGLTLDGIQNQKTEASSGLQPFPCNATNWTRHTAAVNKAAIKHFENSGKDYISLEFVNGAHFGEMLISLDINDIPPGLTPEKAAEARQKNLETLQKVIKILGCHTNGQLDTAKLEKARGQAIAVVAKHKGFRQGSQGGYFHKITYLLNGEVPEMLAVDTSVGLPPLPSGGAPGAPSGGAAPSFDDIPF